ncbi:2Fe-2S ferredoxin [Parasteatoda tepidariorum]|nr:adrenodoxin [Parasteatoda tepidariorum]
MNLTKIPSAFNAIKRSIFRPVYCSSTNLKQVTRLLSTSTLSKNKVTFTVELHGGQRIPMKVEPGITLRDAIAETEEAGEDYGVCGATLACSTCHVILEEKTFKKLKNEITEDEMDILDLAPEIHNLSRLACAIIVGPDLEGTLIKVPTERKDARDENQSEQV